MGEKSPAEAKLLEFATSTLSGLNLIMEVQEFKRARPEIDLNLLDDSDVLARAVRAEKGGYIVELNMGLYFVLYVLFFRLMSDRKIMPWIEDGPSPSSSSGGWLGCLSGHRPGSGGSRETGPSLETVWTATTPSDRPTTWVTRREALDESWANDFWEATENAAAGSLRGRVAHWMTGLAVRFLLAHEMRHVLAGHLDYMKDKFGFVELKAAGGEPLAREEQYRAVEADADIYAIHYLLLHVLATRTTKHEGNAPGRACIREDWHAVLVALLCVATIIYILDSPGEPLTVSPRAKHPSFMARRQFALIQSNRLVKAIGINSIGYRDEKAQEEVTIATFLWIRAENLLAHLFGDEHPRSSSLPECLDEVLQEEHQLDASLMYVYKELKRYAYIENLLQAYELRTV